jgi:hypothetical protein
MAQQTAVDWLIDKLNQEKDILKNHFEGGKWNDDRVEEIDMCLLLCEHAKEMFEQQIETAYDKGTINGIDYPESKLPLTGEQYYTQTYGK